MISKSEKINKVVAYLLDEARKQTPEQTFYNEENLELLFKLTITNLILDLT